MECVTELFLIVESGQRAGPPYAAVAAELANRADRYSTQRPLAAGGEPGEPGSGLGKFLWFGDKRQRDGKRANQGYQHGPDRSESDVATFSNVHAHHGRN